MFPPLLRHLLLLPLLLLSIPAWATDQVEIGLALKSLPLLTQKITGSATMAIIYDPANPASETDARSIKAIMDGGQPVPGGVTLTTKLVRVDSLKELAGEKIGFVANGLNAAQFTVLNDALKNSGMLTVSADLNCVQSAACIIGVAAHPSVTIYYNHAAAEKSGISFAPAFIMLAKQV